MRGIGDISDRSTTWLGWITLVALIGFALATCAHNTVNPSGDGRLFMLLDMPSRVSGGTIRITAEVENHDPVEMVICSNPETNTAVLCLSTDNPLDWRDLQGRPIDLLDTVIDGGSEVRFHVRDNTFDTNQIAFTLDGNTTIRLFINRPDLPGSRHVELELTVQQSLF